MAARVNLLVEKVGVEVEEEEDGSQLLEVVVILQQALCYWCHHLHLGLNAEALKNNHLEASISISYRLERNTDEAKQFVAVLSTAADVYGTCDKTRE